MALRLTSIAAACAAVLSLSAARAADFNETVFFGDSLTDSGTVGAKSTTNPAPVWSELLAGRLGTTAAPFFLGGGGSNFAVGGARVTESTFGIPPAIVDQLDAYLGTAGGRVRGASLYAVWAGANDVFAGTGLQAAADLAGQIGRLQAAGARFILLTNVPDLGLTPNAIASGTTASLAAASAQFNQTLYSAVAARGLRVIAMDTFTLLREVTADPGAYGFVDVTSRACGTTLALLCGPDELVTADADQTFLFADDRHPTAAGHALLADYASSILAAPGQISMLAQTALAMRSAHVDRLFLRLAEPGGARGLWISLDGRRASGYGGGTTVGAELVRGSRWLAGAALGIGRVKPEFGNGGHYAQDEAVVSLYGGWGSGSWRGAAVLSYGALSHEVNRDIRLRTATRTASGSPGGSNLSLGLEAGYRFSTARLVHGPIAGVLLQQARVDAFTEEGGGAAGLRYGEQKRNSAIGRLGWMLAYDAGRWQPYARVSVERELRDTERAVEAQLVTAPELPMFSMPAIEPERNRLTLVAGAAAQLGGAWAANIGALHSEASGSSASALFVTLSAKF